uniref:Anthocyanin 3'-O-beta-glucosyltransferase n=1 Tax=Aegilops tauschii TaxID=37682 RepID=R7VZC5_AEGTA
MATRDEQRQHPLPLHILFLPFFAPGHLIPVVDMTAIFSTHGARCTILTTPVNADIIRPAVDCANDSNCHGTDSSSPAVDISVMPFPDVGLPPGMENLMSLTPAHGAEYPLKFIQAEQLLRLPFDRFMAANRPDAVVSDSFFSWSTDAAVEHDVPRLGSSVFARCCSETMLRNNPLETTTSPDDDPDDDARLVSLPGLQHRVQLRRSQMMDPRKRPAMWALLEPQPFSYLSSHLNGGGRRKTVHTRFFGWRTNTATGAQTPQSFSSLQWLHDYTLPQRNQQYRGSFMPRRAHTLWHGVIRSARPLLTTISREGLGCSQQPMHA